MASVTQTIPQFSLGMSEQPDNLKFPGQVTDIVNAIPDVTNGLFKRPGAKRIGTLPLQNVQTAGSWFHYFRDEIEGSYIGQVAPDGQVRVWRCSDGLLMSTLYGAAAWISTVEYTFGQRVQANNKVYEAQATISSGGSAPSHSSGTTNNWLFIETTATSQTTAQNYLKTRRSATYLQIGTTVNVSNNNHGLAVGDKIIFDGQGTATDGEHTVDFVTPNSFQFTVPSSASGSVSIGTACTYDPLQSELLQFLTINDTTFVNSRDLTNPNTLVGETGQSPSPPDAHFAMLELLRTENGRQYGIDIFRTADVTAVSRATRVAITADNLEEDDGTGHCPGIGTQVFSVTGAAGNNYSNVTTVSVKDSGGNNLANNARTTTIGGNSRNIGAPKNLIFRLNILGQQGVSPNYDPDSEGPGGQNYRCSYQREVVLLHGGEGWKVGDKVQVTLTSAKGGTTGTTQLVNGTNIQQYDGDATYTVTIEEVEEVEVNATISSNGDGLIRPEPTPFDAQTAVTADTIIGGIIGALPSGVSAKQIGNGIYFFSTQSFTVNVVENDLMRVMQSSVNDVQSLPNQCKNGYIVKVSNALRSEEDDYYLRFDGQNEKDGSGSWSECAKSGITTTLTNMPLVIQRTAETTFTVRPFDYGIRDVGDAFTNPMPSFVGKRINKVLFFRNRLAVLAGENVVTSRPGTLARPNFFIETALTVSVADPVDISAASMFPSDLFDGIEINAGLLVFSTNQQFLLASDDTVFNPDTAKLRSIATFNYNQDMPPISLGTTVAYIDNSGKFSRFNEMANSSREGEPNVIEVSKIVPTLLPKDIDLITNSRENSIVLIGKTGTDTVFGYKYFQTADKRAQAAWFKWKLNRPLTYHFIINDEYFFLDNDYFLQSIKLVQSETDPSIIQNNVDFLLHVDNHTTLIGGSYDSASNITTFSQSNSSLGWLVNLGTSANHDLVVIDTNTDPNRVGRYARQGDTLTLSGTGSTSTVKIEITGNWSGTTSTNPLTIGYIYPYEVQLPTLYPTKVDGARSTSDVNSSLVLHRVKFHFGKIGLYETTLERVGKNDYTEIYESTELDEYEASDAPYLEEFIQTVPVYEKNTNVEITLKSSHPAPATLRSLSWEGDYSPKYYRRV